MKIILNLGKIRELDTMASPIIVERRRDWPGEKRAAVAAKMTWNEGKLHSSSTHLLLPSKWGRRVEGEAGEESDHGGQSGGT